MKKPLLYTFATLTSLLVVLWLYFLFTPAVTEEHGRVFNLRPGLSKSNLIISLNEQGIVRSPIFFAAFVYPQMNAHLKTGEYLFAKGSTPFSIWKQITQGRGFVYYQFTIVPGWSFSQLRKHLLETDTLHHLTAKFTDAQIMQYLSTSITTPEGEFFPETYTYTRGVADLVILKRAFDLMQNRLNEAWHNRAAGLPYKDGYQALIAASLIEKEAYLNTERPVIAGVLVNRLKKNMLLQCDPTVIYGLGLRYDGKIHKADLLENTIYNTYVHKGLPPTPIAMPSMHSIEAALHPENNDYYYFVANGDGSHQFSKTLIEHHKAVQDRLNANRLHASDVGGKRG